MSRPHHYFNWQSIVDERADEPVENTRTRLRWLLAMFAFAALAVFARAVQLEVSDGANFRRLAARPIERRVELPARRGRILARDGTVLAGEREVQALAVQYRYLENPPDATWLRRTARARLTPAERRKPERVAAAREMLRGELVELHRRLARLCDLSDAQWQARTTRIQRRVTELAANVNARRLEGFEAELAAEAPTSDVSLATVFEGLFAPPEQLPPPPLIVAEQTAYHDIVDGVAPEIAAEIRNHPDHYPGVKIVQHVRRDYPLGSLAANVIGHLSGDARGLMGIERKFNDTLTGRAGFEIQQVDRRNSVLSSRRAQEPATGGDVVLTIDNRLQQSVEAWLDRRLSGRGTHAGTQPAVAQGGAIVVMDVHTGELLTAASGPRFDPNWFAAGDGRVEAVLNDSRRPLFDRVTRMAIPPGSVFKPLTAIALLENKTVGPQSTFRCQGYFDEPDRLRCQIFRQHGIGHGELTLANALAQSCNVYFFHHVVEMGAVGLVDWATRFGFGQPSGIDLADESTGRLPSSTELKQASQTQMLAIGQGQLTATPLQVVRMYAAIANGGYLVSPRLIHHPSPLVGEGGDGHRREALVGETGEGVSARKGDPSTILHPHPGPLPSRDREDTGAPVPGLSATTLAAVREGLRRIVHDPNGTAYKWVRLPWPAVAGKTGTAETGGEQADHAWFAGYVPAAEPRWAFVVVLEHGGSGAEVAGSIARDLVLRMRELGYFGASPTAERPIPPGKG